MDSPSSFDRQLRVPDVAAEILGFRAWYVDTSSTLDPPKLVSMTHTTFWPHRDWLYAECAYCEGTDIPNEDCSCGIYAAVNRPHLTQLGYNTFGYRSYQDECLPVAIGEVGLAGKIIPGKLGWKGQRGRPVRLWLPYEHWKLIEPLRAAYGVPVNLTNLFKGRG